MTKTKRSIKRRSSKTTRRTTRKTARKSTTGRIDKVTTPLDKIPTMM